MQISVHACAADLSVSLFVVRLLTDGGIADMQVEPVLKTTIRPQNTARQHVLRLHSYYQ